MDGETGKPRYGFGEEVANSVTHGVGVILAVVALALLAAFASVFGNAWHITSCCVFGATLVLAYGTSTLYHSIPLPRAKAVLRLLDHSAIFLLIAGTYTPFTLVSIRGAWGWSLFGVVWGLAVTGILVQFTPLRRSTLVSLGLYVGMGWAVVVAAKPLLASVAPAGMLLLLLGGLAYTLGIGFYVWRRLPYHHAVWHAFVLTGSVLHFFAVLLYVIPVSA